MIDFGRGPLCMLGVPLFMLGRACYVCWSGPIMDVGRGLLYKLDEACYAFWAGPVLPCGILGNAVIFVLTVVTLSVAIILSKPRRERCDCIASTRVSTLTFYATLMSCFDNKI